MERTEIDYTELTQRINSLSYQLGQIPREEMELGIKQRQLNLSEGIYTYLQEKKAEAGIAIASDQVDKEVVDEARVALGGAIGPDKKTILGGIDLHGRVQDADDIIVFSHASAFHCEPAKGAWGA